MNILNIMTPVGSKVPDDSQNPEKEPSQQVPNNDKIIETVAYQPIDNAPATGRKFT